MSRKHGGSGLGLAICLRLATMMGGTAGVSSVPGQGSTFWLTVNLKRRPAAESVKPQVDPERYAEGALSREFAGSRVLLVEDEPVNREIALGMLDQVGLVTDVAEDGEEALARLVGDIAAHRAVGLARGVADWHLSTARRVVDNLAEYFSEEQPMVVKHAALDALSRQTTELRDDLARLDKRLRKLEARG